MPPIISGGAIVGAIGGLSTACRTYTRRRYEYNYPLVEGSLYFSCEMLRVTVYVGVGAVIGAATVLSVPISLPLHTYWANMREEDFREMYE